MSRFAKIDEEVIKRQSELTGEELRLYCLIVFHTWTDSGICNKNLQEICQIYGLNYNHTTERYKNLRKEIRQKMRKGEKERILRMVSPWCENTKKGIRPLVGIRTPKNGVANNDNSEKRSRELRKTELQTPNNGVLEGKKLRKTESPLKEYIEPFKDENFLSAAAEEKTAAAADTNPHKSIFLLKECLRYAEICKLRGENIRSVEALAMSAYINGDRDAFIQATLYPEPIETEKPIEYADDEFDESPEPEPMSERERENMLVIMRGMLRDSTIDALQSLSPMHTPEDWNYLMEELRNVE